MKIEDYDYIGSSIGNAFFSGMSFQELWNCVSISKNMEELDTTIEITIKLKEMIKRNE